MGASLHFNEAGRAAFAALLLQSRGHGVLWNPRTHSTVVMTSASTEECRALLAQHPGQAVEAWYVLQAIDSAHARFDTARI